MSNSTIIHLAPQFFSEKERPLIEAGPFAVSTFLYDTGVAALRMRNEQGELVMLPFQGQQIWSASFGPIRKNPPTASTMMAMAI